MTAYLQEITMRTLISTAFVSLDGVMEGPGGEPGYRNSGWTFKHTQFLPESFEIKGREQEEAGAMLLGRVSYQAFSPVWPGMPEFARYKTLPKYVVSTTLTDDQLVDDWGDTTILRSLDEVAALKQGEGGPIIVHGSAALNHGLSDAGLIDRYHLLVYPLLLGAGKRLFSTADKDVQKLQLVEHEAYANGLQKNVFDVLH
jgi:dihydrofolate reductase